MELIEGFIAGIVSFIVIYFIGSVIAWNYNIGEWWIIGRIIAFTMWIICSISLYDILDNNF